MYKSNAKGNAKGKASGKAKCASVSASNSSPKNAGMEWQIREVTSSRLDVVLLVPEHPVARSVMAKILNLWKAAGIPSAKHKEGRYLEWEWYTEASTLVVQSKDSSLRAVRVLPPAMYTLLLSQNEYRLFSLERETDLKMRWSRVPDSIRSSLKDYQRVAVEKIWTHKGRFELDDDMGLGKTLQSIAAMLGYRDEWPVLVVCPTALRGNWKAEWKQWAGEMPVALSTGKLVPKLLQTKANVFLISYALVGRPEVLQCLKQYKFRCIILDEAHFLKSADSTRSKACISLFSSSDRLVAMTGTPGDRPSDLWPRIRMIQPWMFPRWWVPYPRLKSHEAAIAYKPDEKRHSYASRYCDPKPEHIRSAGGCLKLRWNCRGRSRVKELGDILRHYLYLRRTKAECRSDLPEKNRMRIMLETEQKTAQDSMRKEMDHLKVLQEKGDQQQRYQQQMSKVFNDVMQKIKLPLVTSFFKHEFDPNGLFSECDDGCLVFAHHRETLDTLEELVKEQKWSYVRVDGKTKTDDRHTLVTKFQQDPSVRIALLSMTAVGYGVNLFRAKRVYMVELPWSPATLLQAEDRAHRTGCTADVDIYYLLLQDSLDMTMWQVVQSKQATQNQIFDTRSHEDRERNVPSTVLPTLASTLVENPNK